MPNLSSIALPLQHGNRTALLTGDARGDDLLRGLEASGLLAKDATLLVDVFKLPHHGSENNAAPALFERIKARHYVVSADGIKHEHPSPATLEWLVASRHPERRLQHSSDDAHPCGNCEARVAEGQTALNVLVGDSIATIRL